jgi:hypothetical protein
MQIKYKTTEVIITRVEHSNYEKSVYSVTARDESPAPGHVACLFLYTLDTQKKIRFRLLK